MAKTRKGYYRAGHHVKPSTVSKQWKKPSTGLVVAAVVLAIAGWNTLFDDDSDSTGNTPQPHPSSSSAPATPGQ
ncbi:hypothetical protein ACFWVC_33095 [Streptomyces sp. NPDC058691]|uniref:hypothetical protein n=1 Tax=Streptomyces sp. NPDC058691 TaxID=3346601 RepID=UPI00365AA4E6